MPIVPVYDTPTVAPSAVPDVRQQTPSRMMQAATIGAQEQQRMGQTLVGLGTQGLQLATNEQIQQNEIAAKNHDTAQVTSNDAILHGSNDGKIPGFLSLKGQQAVDAFPETEKKLQQVPVDLAQGLQNPAQQQLVANTQKLRLEAALTQAKMHRDQQLQVSAMTAAQVRRDVGKESSIKSHNPLTDTPLLSFDQEHPENNSAYQQGLQTVAAETRALYAGNAPDVIESQVKNALSDTYVGTLAYMLGGKNGANADSGSLASARKYFDSVKDQITNPEQIDRISQVLDASQKQDDVLKVSRFLESLPGSIGSKRKTLGDAFDKQGAIAGVAVHRDVYEYAMSALDRAEAKQRADSDHYEASVIGQAQDWIIQHPGASVTDLPRNMYVALMNKGHLAAIDSFASREAVVKTPPEAWNQVQTHFGDGSDLDITKLPEADWVKMRGIMSESDWKSWGQKRDNFKKGITPGAKDPGDVSTSDLNSVLNNRLLAIGIDVHDPKRDKAQIGAIQQFVTQSILDDQHAAGKRFNSEEVGKSVDRLFATNVNFRKQFLWFDPTTESKRMLNLKVGDLPNGAYEGIKQDMIRSGNPTPTDRDILIQYWKMHGNRRK